MWHLSNIFYNYRRSLVAGQRPQKRLFTPEIKRYLKDWLVRRRDNPYPNREEKKYLSRETGLTYIQVSSTVYILFQSSLFSHFYTYVGIMFVPNSNLIGSMPEIAICT